MPYGGVGVGGVLVSVDGGFLGYRWDFCLICLGFCMMFVRIFRCLGVFERVCPRFGECLGIFKGAWGTF